MPNSRMGERFQTWMALKGWDNMTLRKAQRTGTTGAAMEAMRAALPTTEGEMGLDG